MSPAVRPPAGIAPAQFFEVMLLFEPFFTTKGAGKGTGQGLAIAHAVVVQKHNGKLDFQTEMGVGTTFFIRLPIEGKPAGQPEALAA
jgi:signal transduction histidine kinase